jgi:DNA-binding Xre family transcriptional regulator
LHIFPQNEKGVIPLTRKSITISDTLYTELEQIGIITAHAAGQREPISPERVALLLLERGIARMDGTRQRDGEVMLPVSLSLCTGDGELVTTIPDYVKEKEIRIKQLQQATSLSTSTLYALADGRMPTVDSLLRLLPALDFPPLDYLFNRS